MAREALVFNLICINSVAFDGFDDFIRLGFSPFLYEFANSFSSMESAVCSNR